jgi:hypothetical protein
MDKKDNVPTARPPPPVPFGVDEAYQSSLNGRSSGGGRGEGIGSNAKRITGYMGRLEEYLTRQEVCHYKLPSSSSFYSLNYVLHRTTDEKPPWMSLLIYHGSLVMEYMDIGEGEVCPKTTTAVATAVTQIETETVWRNIHLDRLPI